MGQIKNIKLHIVTDIKRTTTTTTITTMGFIEVRSHAWQDGCEDLVNQLRELGFHAGQIYAIDVHNNGPDEEAIISAHWIGDPVGEDDKKCHVDFEILNDNDDWSVHYEWADERVAELRGDGKRVINLTHTINTESRGVTVLFYEHHNPYQFL